MIGCNSHKVRPNQPPKPEKSNRSKLMRFCSLWLFFHIAVVTNCEPVLFSGGLHYTACLSVTSSRCPSGAVFLPWRRELGALCTGLAIDS